MPQQIGRASYRVDFDPGRITGDIQQVISRTIQYATLLAESEAKQNAPRDTGTLARSITHDIEPLRARVYSPLAYAGVIEAGRTPGAKAPPPAALQGWARRHGYTGSLWVLARAIGRAGWTSSRGRANRFYFRRAIETMEAQLPALVQRAMREVG